MYLRNIVEELARDRGEDLATTAATTTANARRFFALPLS
jgi:TatD DNase family protein